MAERSVSQTPAERGATVSRYPVEHAAQFIRQQFGADEKWQRINQLLWDYFTTYHGERLGLSSIRRIAVLLGVSLDDVLAVVSVLTGPHSAFLRRVYYYRTHAGPGDEVPPSAILTHTRRWWCDQVIDGAEWQRWAGQVLVGWEPALRQTQEPPTS
jgi:hypothetical protein